MKYSILLRILRSLVYTKRFVWWLGGRMLGGFAHGIQYPYRGVIYLRYKAAFLLKRFGIVHTKEWIFKRDFLQIVIFVALVIVAIPQTKLVAKADPLLAGKKTIAYRLSGPYEEEEIQEIVADEVAPLDAASPSWRQGLIDTQWIGAGGRPIVHEQDLTSIMAGGSALGKPTIIPGSLLGRPRDRVVDYVVEPGDALGRIAFEFGVSVETIMWENGLGLRSIIRPGDVLKIPPITGLRHTIKRGDTLRRLASLYQAEESAIVKFNHLREDGTDLIIGEQIMIPDGVRPQDRVTPAPARTVRQIARQIAVPPGSTAAASVAGFVWPSAARILTQYFGWRHTGIDVAGPWQSAIYAAKSGVVEKSQCGWNSGYGCMVLIDHGGGVKTLYGHSSQLLVSAGESVSTGQTISLMGNTGNVRGRTGIHLHFEIHVNGRKVNPLGYVK